MRELNKVRLSDGHALRRGLAVVEIIKQCVENGASFELVETELETDEQDSYHTFDISARPMSEPVAAEEQWKRCTPEVRRSLTTVLRFDSFGTATFGSIAEPALEQLSRVKSRQGKMSSREDLLRTRGVPKGSPPRLLFI